MRSQASGIKYHFNWIIAITILIELFGITGIDSLANDIWVRKSDMTTPRYGLSTSVVDGIIYAIGGVADELSLFFSTVEAYDPVTNTWTRKADMPTVRAFHSTSVVEGQIYAIGGISSNSLVGLPTVEAYDPAKDTWTTKADMPTARFALSTSVENGQIYAIGGTQSSGWTELSTVEVYDPVTDTWTTKSDMPTARVLFATSVVNSQIYAIGGAGWSSNWDGMSTVEAYDPTTDTWITRANMPTARLTLSTSAVAGIIYAISGTLGPGEKRGYPGVSTVEAYDPVTNTWSAKADMPTPRGRLSTSFVNGRIYAIGGSEFWPGEGHPVGEVYSIVEEYNPGGVVTIISPQGKLMTVWGNIKQQ